jgi:hypothetical protein
VSAALAGRGTQQDGPLRDAGRSAWPAHAGREVGQDLAAPEPGAQRGVGGGGFGEPLRVAVVLAVAVGGAGGSVPRAEKARTPRFGGKADDVCDDARVMSSSRK